MFLFLSCGTYLLYPIFFVEFFLEFDEAKNTKAIVSINILPKTVPEKLKAKTRQVQGQIFAEIRGAASFH